MGKKSKISFWKTHVKGISELALKDVINDIIEINYKRIQIASLIVFGFAAYILSVDFFFGDAWETKILPIYKILDFGLGGFMLFAIIFFWFIPIKSVKVKQFGILVFVFVTILWAAIIAGVDFPSANIYSTFVVILLICTYFIYLSLWQASTLYLLPAGVLFFIIVKFHSFDKEAVKLIVPIVPILVISILIARYVYIRMLRSLFHQKAILEMNKALSDAKENLNNTVEKRTRELRIANLKLEESLQLKTAFLNSISHEFRTPMNSIKGFSGLLKNPDLNEKERLKYIAFVNESCEELSDIVTDTVEISQLQSKTVELNSKSIHLHPFLLDFIDEWQTTHSKEGVKFLITIDQSLEGEDIIIDSYKLKRIIKLLLDNALKFTDKGSVVFDCLFLRSEIKIMIKDTGIGIDPDKIDRIYEPFTKLHVNEGKVYGGNGLGLAIVKGFLQLMKGEIIIESEPGKGTNVFVSVPIKP